MWVLSENIVPAGEILSDFAFVTAQVNVVAYCECREAVKLFTRRFLLSTYSL
jgi:hypothetical protein